MAKQVVLWLLFLKDKLSSLLVAHADKGNMLPRANIIENINGILMYNSALVQCNLSQVIPSKLQCECHRSAKEREYQYIPHKNSTLVHCVTIQERQNKHGLVHHVKSMLLSCYISLLQLHKPNPCFWHTVSQQLCDTALTTLVFCVQPRPLRQRRLPSSNELK